MDCGIPEGEYRREIRRCLDCGVFNNIHDYDLDRLYEGAYNRSVYADAVLEKYRAIRALPPERSDNKLRVRRILDFLRGLGVKTYDDLKLLDVGSGLCVFAGEMKERGFDCFCVDPDPLSAEHAEKNAGATKAYCGIFESLEIDERFDLITFNKVLEHVKNPVEMLRRGKGLLKPGGLLYVELPEGDRVAREGRAREREEFFVEHYTVFEERSIRRLLEMADVRLLETEQLIEPSGKYTIYSFSNAGKGIY